MMSDSSTTTPDLPAHRLKVREKFGPTSNGYLYFGFANVVALAAMAAAAWLMQDVSPWAWLTIPISFLVVNLGEWISHKGPMHRRRDYAPFVYDHHTDIHHIYFRHDDMAAHDHHEWSYVLFPVWAIFLVVLGAIPLALVPYAAFGLNVACLAFITVIAYYLLYEWFHLMYHLPEDHPVGGAKIVQWLRRHHQNHHDTRLMSKYNFNVTFPICDYLFGTVYRPEAETARPDVEARPVQE